MSKKRKKPQLPPVSEEARRRQQSRREEMAALLAERKRAERRKQVLTQVGIGALLVALVVGITVAVLVTRDGDDGPVAVPSGLTPDGSVRFGAADAAVTLEVVEDFQCPACRQLEAAAGEVLADYREADDVAVEYHPIAFLDRASTDEYSSRALNASMCVLDDAGPDAWMAMHDALYDEQPQEGGAGLPDGTLVSMAVDAGADEDAVASCIGDRTYDKWGEQQTDRFFDDGGQGTPTVFVDGEQVEPAQLQSAVEAAREAARS